MLRDIDIINTIKGRELEVGNLDFFATHRCNLRCRHCYLGKVSAKELKPEVADAVLSYFKTAHNINLLGGESTRSTSGLRVLDSALKEHKTRFGHIGMVSNFAVYDDRAEENLEILESIARKSDSDLLQHWNAPVVQIAASNDGWHVEELERRGITAEMRKENMAKMKAKHPKFWFGYGLGTGFDDYVSKWNYRVAPIGNARKLSTSEARFTAPKWGEDLRIEMVSMHGTAEVARFAVTATGKVVKDLSVDLVQSETQNLGDVLVTPIEDILIEHGIGARGFDSNPEEFMRREKEMSDLMAIVR